MKNSPLRIFYALMLCLVLCLGWLPGRAEDCFVIDVDFLDMDSLRSNDYVAANLSSAGPGIRIQKYISDSDELVARVRLTILQVETGTVVFDKNYSYQSKVFDSGDIYLPYADNHTVPYLISLYMEDWTYVMPFMHLAPRLSYNGASTYGVRLSDYQAGLSSNWFMGTMIDVNELRSRGTMTVPLCASNSFLVGEALVSLRGETLVVSLDFVPQAQVELHQSTVYLIPRVAEINGRDIESMFEYAYGLNQGIDVSGFSSALLYLPMSISYHSAGLQQFGYDLWGNADLQRQLALWNDNFQQMAETTPLIPLVPIPEEMVFPELPAEQFPTEEIPFVPEGNNGDMDMMDPPPVEPLEEW